MFILNVSKTYMEVLLREPLVAGTVNSVDCQFVFSADWEGLDRTAVFYTKLTRKSCALVDGSTCVIPWEVLERAGQGLYVGVYGSRNGSKVLTTVPERLDVVQPGAQPGELTREYSPDVYEQIYSAASQAVSTVQELRQDALNGTFNGKSPYIGADGYWYIYDDEAGEFTKTDTPANADADQDALRRELLDTLGDIPADKTVARMIAEAQAAAAYDDTALTASVSANTRAISLLNGSAAASGSVAWQIAQAVSRILDNPGGTMDSVQELVDWVTSHNTDALAMSNAITQAQRDIDALEALVGRTSVASQIAAAMAAALKINGADKYALAADLTLAVARILTLEQASHTHANREALDAIQPGDKEKWDAMPEALRSWVQQQNYYQGGMPQKGVDYWTQADQEDMVQQVIAALGTPVFGTVDDDNNITLTGALADGVYTLAYEDAQGNRTVIGGLRLGSSDNLIDTAGYTDGQRLSTTSGGLKAASGITSTGYLEVSAPGDVFRTAGIVFNCDAMEGGGTAVLLNSDKSAVLAYHYLNSNKKTDAYLESQTDADGNATVTVNAAQGYPLYLRLCGQGSGADLLVTRNREIG